MSAAEEILDELIESVVTETAVQLHRWIQTGGGLIRSTLSSDSQHRNSMLVDRRSLYPDLYPTEESLQQDLDRFAVEPPPAKRTRRPPPPEETAAAAAVVPSSGDSAILADPTHNVVIEPSNPITTATPCLVISVDGQLSSQPQEKVEEVVVSSSSATGTATTTTLHNNDSLPEPTTSTSTTVTPADTMPATTTLVPSSFAVPCGPQSSVVAHNNNNYNNTDIWGSNPAKEPFGLISCSMCRSQVSGLRFASHLDKCLGIGTMSRNASSHGHRKS